MKIGLNAISFVPGRMGGMETYFRNLVAMLQRLDRENRYTLFCDRRFAGAIELGNPGFAVSEVNYAKPSLKWFARGVLRNLCNLDILGAELKGRDLDVM